MVNIHSKRENEFVGLNTRQKQTSLIESILICTNNISN